MAHEVDELLTRYRDARREVMTLVNKLRAALTAEYMKLGLEPPASLTSVLISPVDARVEALDLGYVIMENNERYSVGDLLAPEKAAARLRVKLIADIEKSYNLLQDSI